jgi:hypothetical protein
MTRYLAPGCCHRSDGTAPPGDRQNLSLESRIVTRVACSHVALRLLWGWQSKIGGKSV